MNVRFTSIITMVILPPGVEMISHNQVMLAEKYFYWDA